MFHELGNPKFLYMDLLKVNWKNPPTHLEGSDWLECYNSDFEDENILKLGVAYKYGFIQMLQAKV